MPSISEEIQERAVGRDEPVGCRLNWTKVEVYLKKLILWIRILILFVLVLSLVTIVVWNCIAPTSKDVSDRVRQVAEQDKLGEHRGSGGRGGFGYLNPSQYHHLISQSWSTRWARRLASYSPTPKILRPMEGWRSSSTAQRRPR